MVLSLLGTWYASRDVRLLNDFRQVDDEAIRTIQDDEHGVRHSTLLRCNSHDTDERNFKPSSSLAHHCRGSFTFSHKSLTYYLTHQMPLGFGNAVVLQTMFSKNLSFLSYLTLIPSPSSRIGVASARIPNANRHWFRTIIARIRYSVFLHSSSLAHKSTP